DRHADADAAAGAHAAGLDGLAVAAHRDLGGSGRGALVLDAEGDVLRLPDDAEARRGYQHDPSVALVLVAGDQAVYRRAEAERRRLAGDVVHAPVGDEDDAGYPVVWDVGERRGQRGEESRAVGLAVGFAGFDETHFHPGHASQPLGDRRAHRLGLLGAI